MSQRAYWEWQQEDQPIRLTVRQWIATKLFLWRLR